MILALSPNINMGWFSRKKEDDTSKNFIRSDEYERLSKRVIELDTEIKSTKIDVKVLQTDVDNLRGNFNRKLKGLAKEESEETSKQQNINSDGYLPFG